MRKKFIQSVLPALALSLTLQGCQVGAEAAVRDPKSMAQAVSQGVGTVSQSSPGSVGAPILVFEERHDSRLMQLQQAISLVRLYYRQGLRDIALEGFLQGSPPIETDWFAQAAGGDHAARISVAARQLQEGEISAAEFMELAFDDITLHPIELSADYDVVLTEDGSRAPYVYLLKLAYRSFKPTHHSKLQDFQRQIDRLDGKAKQRKVDERLDYIFSADSWTDAHYQQMKKWNEQHIIIAEDRLAWVEAIQERAAERSIQLTADERKAMGEALAFWRGRARAGGTMMGFTAAVADRPGVPVVAMVTGSAHTKGLVEVLEKAARPFAVVTPQALTDFPDGHKSDLSLEAFQRKYNQRSIYSEGFLAELLEDSAGGRKKPRPVLAEDWMKVKDSLFCSIEATMRAIGRGQGGGAPPNRIGGIDLPTDFPEDGNNGVRIVAAERVYDDPLKKKGSALLFEVQIRSKEGRQRRTVWVKAAAATSPFALDWTDSQMQEDAARHELELKKVEALLQRALQEVESEEQPENRAEDEAGRVQISMDTNAVLADSRAGAENAVLKSAS